MLDLTYKKLEAWQLSMEYIKEVYSLCGKLPKEELFGLRSQMTRAAVSIASNIAEGVTRESQKEKSRVYEISKSSLVEVNCQLDIAIMLNYFSQDEASKARTVFESIYKLLSKMINTTY